MAKLCTFSTDRPTRRNLAWAALATALWLPLAPPPPAAAQSAQELQITWEVRNRFRLFREERDFKLHSETLAHQSILDSERALAIQSEGRGWARNTVARLCVDGAGKIAEPCVRDGAKESYLTPIDHPVTVRLSGPIPVGAVCAWKFSDSDEPPRQFTFDCAEPINFRAQYGVQTNVTVDVTSGADGSTQLRTQIVVRDILIAGLGDSIGSGEGNPDRPIALADNGFCFRTYLEGPGGQYYRPSRASFKGGRACESYESLQNWQRAGAQWMNAACHRSLYSYQTRTALAIAAQNPRIAVTYLPLACSGATVADGLLGSQRARECLITKSAVDCQGTVAGQVSALREMLASAKRKQPNRTLDLLLLSVGANDADFSGLVADVIVDSSTERALFQRGGLLGSVEASRTSLSRTLPGEFAKLRTALKPIIGPDLSRVVYVSYANPTLANGTTCPGGPAGFDVQPTFNADPKRLAKVSTFVAKEFLPAIKAIATCSGGTICKDPARESFTFVDTHQPIFANHGFCARADTDPEFDRACFSERGDSFESDIVAAASQPLKCDRRASEYRSYLPRARWIRDANDSYFSAMTYPQGLSAIIQPADIHDATWGILSAVYGGAIHPTAEGHAAMADAALPAALSVLRIINDAEVTQKPLAPVPGQE